MAKKTIKAQMKQRRDTKANWAATNPVLLDGELGIVSDDPNLYKVGDGATAWNSLPFRGFDGTLAQELGTSPNAVISQKVVSEKLTELESEVGEINHIISWGNTEHSSLNDRLLLKKPISDCYISLINISTSIADGFACHVYAYKGDVGVWDKYVALNGNAVRLLTDKEYDSIGVYVGAVGNGDIKVCLNKIYNSNKLAAINLNRGVRFNRYNSILVSDVQPNILTSTSNNVVVKFLENNILFYDNGEISIPAGTEYVIPSSSYLLYDIRDKKIIISSGEAYDASSHIMLVDSHRGVPKGGILADIAKQRKLLRGSMNANANVRFNRYDNIVISSVWDSALTGGVSVLVRFVGDNIIFYNTDEVRIAAGTNFEVPHNSYLYYDIYAKQIFISNEKKDNCDFILLLDSHRGIAIGGVLARIDVYRRSQKNLAVQKIPYWGRRIEPKNVAKEVMLYSFEQSGSSINLDSQGMEILHDSIIVQGTTDVISNGEYVTRANLALIDIASKKLISQLYIQTDSDYNHINSLCAGMTRSGYLNPLLYLSEGYGSGRCFVAQVADDYQSLEIIQIIQLNVDGFTDWCVDVDNEWLYAKVLTSDSETGSCDLYRFEIPSVDNANIALNSANAIQKMTLPSLPIPQGIKIYNGKLFYCSGGLRGYPSFLNVINLDDMTIESQMEWSHGEAEDVAAYQDGYVIVNNAHKPSYYFYRF